MPRLTIEKETLLQLINSFYKAYDSARQFDEAFSLYQAVVAGDRDPVELMNALYETYPAAKANLMCQAVLRFEPEKYDEFIKTQSPETLTQNMTWEKIIQSLDADFDGIRVDLLPKDSARRLTILVREVACAYCPTENIRETMQSTVQMAAKIDSIEEELGRKIKGDDPAVEESTIVNEVEQYYASKATDDEKQRAAFWRVVFASDVRSVVDVDAQIKVCDGNAVQATRIFREKLRNSTVRLESNLQKKNQQQLQQDDEDDGGAPLPGGSTSSQQQQDNSRTSSQSSSSQHLLPGSDARSSSAQDKKSIEHLRTVLEKGNVSLQANEKRLREKEQELAAKSQRTPEDLAKFAAIRDELNAQERDLQEVQQECHKAAARLNERQLQLEAWEKALTMRESELSARQQSLAEKEEQHLIDSQKRVEALQVSAAAVTRREQMVEVKEHVITQRENEVRRKEEQVIEREHSTDKRAEAIVQRSLELEKLIAEYELRSLRVKTREAAIWKSYVNQQLASADPSDKLLTSNSSSSSSSSLVNSTTLQTLSKELKSVRGHLERLGTVAGSFHHQNNSSGSEPSNNNFMSASRQQQYHSDPSSTSSLQASPIPKK